MFTEGIIIAFITGGMAILSNVVIVVFNNSKTIYRIEQLEKKVEKHNNYMERLLQAEVQIEGIKEDVQEIRGRCNV